MDTKFAVLPHTPLHTGSRCVIPQPLTMEDPAIQVMTDFNHVRPFTTFPEVFIEDVQRKMHAKGAHLLLVIDDDESVIGLITPGDVQGEKPIQLVHDTGTPHAQLTVGMLMTPVSDIQILPINAVHGALVGHIVTTLHDLECHYLLVANVEPGTGKQSICGMFSSTKLGKHLHMEVSEVMTAAHNLAELQHEMN